jgi:hypothetical protein
MPQSYIYNNITPENCSSGGAKAAAIGTTQEQGTACRASRNLPKLTRSTIVLDVPNYLIMMPFGWAGGSQETWYVLPPPDTTFTLAGDPGAVSRIFD